MNIPEELRYTKSHEWLKEEDGVCTVGLTDFAQHALGISSLSTCPRRGTLSPPGRPLGDVESVKAVSDVLSPVSGVVKAVNEELLDNPALVNEDPYGAWLIQVEQMTDEEELLDAAAYEAHCAAGGGLTWPDICPPRRRSGPPSTPPWACPARRRCTGTCRSPCASPPPEPAPPQSELEARRTLEALAEQNLRFRTILRGAGAYDHYIPAAVSRIASKEEFVTAYTPLSGGDQPGGAPVHFRVPDHDL